MAQIVINEVSRSYTYNINDASFATVAMPLTASWGPAYEGTDEDGVAIGTSLDEMQWTHFPATQAGLESFVATYRGPAANYRLAKDYSYQIAMTLLTAGYDVLTCRLSPGAHAQGSYTIGSATLNVVAKYPGTFGNSLQTVLSKVKYYNNNTTKYYWNLVTYILDSSGVRTAVENLSFVFQPENSSDTLLSIDEIESNFLTLVLDGTVNDDTDNAPTGGAEQILLTGGTDKADETSSEASALMDSAIAIAKSRFELVGLADEYTDCFYATALNALKTTPPDKTIASTIRYREWIFTEAINVYDLLKDQLSYNPNRIISPGWDDIDTRFLNGKMVDAVDILSPLHVKLMDIAYYSRCATSLIDIPRSLRRSGVWNNSNVENEEGYAQRLSRYLPPNASYDVNGSLYVSHSALGAPWGQYVYVGTSKQNIAPPSFLILMIQKSMLMNQSVQYEWALPTNRQHSLTIGKMDYTVPKKYLDQWQTIEGVGVNVITTIPGLGTTVWGNSTLYEVPPATYQALANLSTRYLVNAVEDVVYKCGISITFQYSNEEAYSQFYAGVTPILDTMRNVGAIEDYYVKMSSDVNGLDQVNYQSVVGTIYLVIQGVINDITVDLVCLPPDTDLDQYRNN